MKVPYLKKKPELKSCHNVEWEDNYSWIHQENILEVLQDKTKLLPEVKKYLEDENEYTDYHLKNTKNVQKSISINIIGTSNLVNLCEKYGIKLIYFSTNYVYPFKKGTYKENHPVLPINNYAWSKLGGESSVIMYKNSLILRASITEKPFVHKVAFVDFKTNFIFHEDLVPKIMKVLNCKGVLNVGGKSQSVYNFVKKYNKKIKKIYAKKLLGHKAPKNISMNIKRFKKLTDD